VIRTQTFALVMALGAAGCTGELRVHGPPPPEARIEVHAEAPPPPQARVEVTSTQAVATVQVEAPPPPQANITVTAPPPPQAEIVLETEPPPPAGRSRRGRPAVARRRLHLGRRRSPLGWPRVRLDARPLRAPSRTHAAVWRASHWETPWASPRVGRRPLRVI